MVTRANRRFHLIKLLFSCSFVAIFFVRSNQEKKPEKCGAAVANILRLNFVATTSASKYITDSFRECGKLDQQIGYHIAAIGFAQHFVPAALIKIMSD
jgi:hypothetical protein